MKNEEKLRNEKAISFVGCDGMHFKMTIARIDEKNEMEREWAGEKKDEK